jgi:hypothetical protein
MILRIFLSFPVDGCNIKKIGMLIVMPRKRETLSREHWEAHVKDAMIQKALRLKELDKLIIKAIATWDLDQFSEYVVEFNESKKHIRSYGLEHPLINLQEIENPDARLIIEKIMSGELLSVEKAMSGSTIE